MKANEAWTTPPSATARIHSNRKNKQTPKWASFFQLPTQNNNNQAQTNIEHGVKEDKYVS